jgi:ribosomal protein S18 acetylase RimI-like enzyme
VADLPPAAVREPLGSANPGPGFRTPSHYHHIDASMTLIASTITPSDAERAVAAIVLAFSTDPIARWTFPDPHQYLTHFPAGVRAFGGKAFAHGTGHQVGGFAGAALWLPPGVLPDEEALVTILRDSVAEASQGDVFMVLERMGACHPAEPHWYLPLIGVDPAHQRQGFGSVLLQHALSQCDHDHTPAYLESSNPANIPLYRRHGFEVMGTIQVGSSPPVFPMLRPAR